MDRKTNLGIGRYMRFNKLNTIMQKAPDRHNIIADYTKNKEIESVPKQAKKKFKILKTTPYENKQGQA